MTRAIELDEFGRLILTDGIAFGPPLGAIQTKALQNGDVLIWYSSNVNRTTKAIQEFSQGPFSHVGIYVGDGFSVDAGPAGVSLVKINDLIANFDYGWVFRKPNMTSVQQSKVVAAARSNINRAYAWMDAIALPLRRRAFYAYMTQKKRWNWITILGRTLITWRRFWPPSPKRTFCSRMVIEAYAVIGHFPPDHIFACTHTPFDLAADTFFAPVGWLCNSAAPVWHPFDPYSPKRVTQRTWAPSPIQTWLSK
ncbi:Permuted papain-like amidase enzyme, YaeF/YiiX, C92 family [Comamonadaceae bacterium]